MTGELIDKTVIGDVTAELRFIDWEQPEHRDTQGYAVPRYSLRVERDGEARSFTGWGSIAEAQDQEKRGTAREYLAMVARDGLMWYDHGGDTPEGAISVQALADEHSDVFDAITREWGIEEPSEAIRTVSAVVSTVRKFDALGLDYDGLGELHERAEQRPEQEA